MIPMSIRTKRLIEPGSAGMAIEPLDLALIDSEHFRSRRETPPQRQLHSPFISISQAGHRRQAAADASHR
jgi:hypothetical protein